MCRSVKYLLIIHLLVVEALSMSAQTIPLSQVKAELDAMFAGLDKTRVPTGYLWDTSVNLIDGDEFSGSALTDSNYVSLGIMADMLQSINSASVGADTICVQAAIKRIDRNSSPYNQMIGILFKPFNYIVANALNDNLINYSGGVVSDSFINGVWQNPYGQSVLFGFAPGNSAVAESVSFTIANIDSLSTQSFQSIQFDPGDGGGFRSVSMGGTVSVNYSVPGTVETKLLVAVGGQTYLSHGWLTVRASHISPNSTPHLLPDCIAEYEGVEYRAKISCDSLIQYNKQPLIVSEGFDPWKLSPNNDIHSYSGFTDISNILGSYDLMSFLSSNYDIYYVDWYDCGADIRANAEVFKKVIRCVDSCNTSGLSNVVLGQSMGSLIARYALRDMELKGKSHNTSLFISHDVPYFGANVSPGIMFAYQDICDLATNTLRVLVTAFSDNSDVFFEFLKLGSFQSVKQMLPYYVNSNWHYDNTEFLSLKNDFANMGFPQGDVGATFENVAIINGARKRDGSFAWFSSGDKILDFQFRASTGVLPEAILSALSYLALKKHIPFVWIPGKTSINLKYSIYPFLSNNCLVATSQVVFTKKFLWLASASYILNNKQHYAPASGVAFDAVTGSYYDIDKIDPTDYLPNNNNFWWGSNFTNLENADTIMFIPTASAMAINDFGRDFRANKPVPLVEVPYSAYILSDTSTYHTSFFNGVGSWLDRVVGSKVSVSPVIFGNTTAQLLGISSGYTCNWISSDPSIAAINSSGVISPNGNGLVTVTANCFSDLQAITKSADVLVGYPAMTLRSWMMPGNKCLVKANAGSGVERKLVKAAVDSCLLSYRWGVKYGNQAISWTTSQADTVQVNLPSSGTVIVYLQWQRPGGQTGGETSIELLRGGSFRSNLNDIQVRNGTAISYSENLFGDPEITSDYGHTCFTVSTYMNGQDTTSVASVQMGDLTFPLTETRYSSDGKPVYVFDILYDSDFLSELYDKYVQNLNSSVIVPFYLNDSAGPFQKLDIFCRRVSHEGPIFEDPE